MLNARSRGLVHLTKVISAISFCLKSLWGSLDEGSLFSKESQLVTSLNL